MTAVVNTVNAAPAAEAIDVDFAASNHALQVAHEPIHAKNEAGTNLYGARVVGRCGSDKGRQGLQPRRLRYSQHELSGWQRMGGGWWGQEVAATR